MPQIKIYTKETCPYCVMAKNLLKQKGVDLSNIQELRIDLDESLREKMINDTGRRTVPQIYIGDLHVGGFDDLSKLNQDGKLSELLK